MAPHANGHWPTNTARIADAGGDISSDRRELLRDELVTELLKIQEVYDNRTTVKNVYPYWVSPFQISSFPSACVILQTEIIKPIDDRRQLFDSEIQCIVIAYAKGAIQGTSAFKSTQESYGEPFLDDIRRALASLFTVNVTQSPDRWIFKGKVGDAIMRIDTGYEVGVDQQLAVYSSISFTVHQQVQLKDF